MKKLPKATIFEIALLLFNYRTRYRVEGDSMTPSLMPGDQVLIDGNAEIAAGDIVVARHPFKKNLEMIKRVSEIDADEKYFLISDNPAGSSDSRSFGPVPRGGIIGKVVSHLS